MQEKNENILAKTYEPREVEASWYSRWVERGYFRPEVATGEGAAVFSMVMPPPNITGDLHMGHAVTATIEDILTRWHRMQGHVTLWLPGTDHAGIATQMVVERELMQKEGKTRHDLGREAFLERVWEWKAAKGSRITEQHKALGTSCDWSRERFTLDEGLSKAVREVFVRLFEEGLIHRASRLINWCPRCRTAISDLEVEHEEQKGSLWHLEYPVEDSDKSLIVATTRPETMLGDTGVAVHPDDERYKDLIGKRVRLPLVGRLIPIVADPVLVDPEFGSGAVKVTPAHDFNDFETGRRHGLEEICVLDEAAVINENGGPYAGLDRFEARKRILQDLEAAGLLKKTEDYPLSAGTCQRCSAVVEPTLSMQWFVKAEVLAEPAVQAVERGETVFIPKSWEKTYFHWMRNIQDWCISRQLWWGHRIPAWYCSADHVTVAREAPSACSVCGDPSLRQDEDVLDTWFSSALWPFSTLGWPEETADLRRFYPTTVMETGFDIIFFWVARMMMMGLHFMGEVPFRTVYLHAMVRDEKGQKMSKTRGNVVDPLEVTEKYGADALRFTLASMAGQGRDVKLSLDRVAGYQAFANKIWNAARFALMNLESYVPDGKAAWDRPLELADRWILSRLEKAIRQSQASLEDFRFDDAARTVYGFFWHELCDWYIELSKPALRGELGDAPRAASQAVLIHCLDSALRLLHPFMPFITEEIWQKLPIGDEHPESIVISPYPTPVAERHDDAAELAMVPIISAIGGVRTLRGESNIPPKARVPVLVHASDPVVRKAFEDHSSYLLALTNAASLKVAEPGERPSKSAVHVDAGMEVFVLLEGVVDLEEERRRLNGSLDKIDKELSSLVKRLENKSFVERAPSEVVMGSRERVESLREQEARLKENLARLAGE